jgi:two-component system NarL family sensor kinase
MLRATNTGYEPVGRNWWFVADTVLGTTFLPLGTALAVRGRVALGLCFAVVAAGGLLNAIAAEWTARSGAGSGPPVIAEGRPPQVIGLSVLVLVVPFLLPWPRAGARDPLTRWLAVGAASGCIGTSAALFDRIGDLPGAHVAGPLFLIATVPFTAVGAYVADVRNEPGALGKMSRRFLFWVILASGIGLLYTVLVAGFGLLLGANGPAWLLVGVTVVVAVAVEPARSRLRQIVDSLFYGQRGAPLTVVRQLVNQQVATAADVTDTLLPSLAATLASGLRLDHVAIDVCTTAGEWKRVGESGSETDHDELFPLMRGEEEVGRLITGCRDNHLGRRYREVLGDVVPHLTVAVGVVQLTRELQRSRLRELAAREEERRRLRRDLHDRVGPALTGISMGLHAVLRRLRRNDAAIEDVSLLAQLAAEVDRSAGDVKRIVRDLRPSALDDQGLAGALAEFVRSLNGVLDVDLRMPGTGGALPAAVETATYHITMEALNNVVRHAAATRCSVLLTVSDHVDLDITDNGIGIPARHRPGVGLVAMRERASELGGSTEIGSVSPHGTRVHAVLPMSVP